jgi:hypothetical protein
MSNFLFYMAACCTIPAILVFFLLFNKADFPCKYMIQITVQPATQEEFDLQVEADKHHIVFAYCTA